MKHCTLIAAILLVVIAGSAHSLEPAARNAAPFRLVVIGDSTVCDYPPDSPGRGWGQYLQENFKGSVKVINLARSGRSTKTFIKDGLWKKALGEKADFVLIQFGHNDSHAHDRPEATDAATTFKDYLRLYIGDCRASGATPILVTPMHRRTFGRDGKLDDNLRPYATAMKEVATEKKVAIIDLHTMSGELFQKLGETGSAEMANKVGDQTHFNEKGARAMAALVMQELPRVEPRLARELAGPAQ